MMEFLMRLFSVNDSFQQLCLVSPPISNINKIFEFSFFISKCTMCISLLLGFFFVFKKSHISFIIVVIYSHLFIFLLDVPFFNILISFYWFRIDEFDELSGVFVNVVLFMRFCLLLLPFLLCLYRKSQGEKEKFIVAYKRNIRETCVSIPIL